VAITPAQVRNQEFPIRLKGYDPDTVRAFLAEVAAAYRATIRDEGAQWALHNISDDLAAVVRAAHAAAEKVLASAEDEAEACRTKAEIEAGVIRHEAEVYAERARSDADAEAARAIQVLKRTQGQAADVHRDADEARSLLADARTQAEQIIAEAESRAAYVHDEAAAALATHRAEAMADREEARALLERIEARARDLLASAERDAAEIRRVATRDARARVLELHEQGEEVRATAEEQARARVAEVLREGQARLDALDATERAMQDRLQAAQQEFQEIVHRLLVSDQTTIDLTEDEPFVILDGRYDAHRPVPPAASGARTDRSSDAAPGPSGPAPDDADAPPAALVRQMVSLAAGRATAPVAPESTPALA
jgi:DivIVA domain-containing protein